MASGEPSPCLMKQIQLAICQICGRDMGHSSHEPKVNYQKQVDEPSTRCDGEKDSRIPQNPVPHPKPLFPVAEPLITHTPTIEYRVTSEVRHKPANIPGLLYIMNHGAMERSDVETWIEKKKRMAEMKEPWPYTQIIPDQRYDEIEVYLKRKKGMKDDNGKKIPVHVCVPYPMSVAVQQSASPPGTARAKPPAKDQPAVKDAENSTTTKAACLPIGGGCPPPVKMMLCLPCPPPDAAVAASAQSAPRKKPKDYTYRCESRELRGGNLYQCCQCNKRNGLQHDCPRTPCQGRPACLVKPWPDCWPSGGCHGIDYTRENGVKRYDPCSEQRFDKKECKPPSHQAKPDCGGNMMIVVCPAPQTT